MRVAIAGSEKADDEIVKLPATTPFAAGVNTTPVEQLAPGPRLVAQVFWVRLKAAEVETTSPEALTVPVLEIVATWAALGSPSRGWVKFI
jgi:hypothetical protein